MLSFTAVARGTQPAGGRPPKVSTTHPAATPPIIRALTQPDTVIACRLFPVPGGADEDSAKADSLGWMGPYSIQSFGRSPDRELAVRIAMLLVDQSNYVPNDEQDCPFYPRDGLRYISSASDTVDVLLSFNCSLVMVMTSDGKQGWGGDVTPVGDEVKGLVRPLLPAIIPPAGKSPPK